MMFVSSGRDTETLQLIKRKRCTREHTALKDAGLLLEPEDVFHDLLDVLRFHGVDLRHVAELPMVRLDAVGGGAQEGHIAMVIGD